MDGAQINRVRRRRLGVAAIIGGLVMLYAWTHWHASEEKPVDNPSVLSPR